MRWKDRIVDGPLFPAKFDAMLDRIVERVLKPNERVWWAGPAIFPLIIYGTAILLLVSEYGCK